jgi:hypothetical protein
MSRHSKVTKEDIRAWVKARSNPTNRKTQQKSIGLFCVSVEEIRQCLSHLSNESGGPRLNPVA